MGSKLSSFHHQVGTGVLTRTKRFRLSAHQLTSKRRSQVICRTESVRSLACTSTPNRQILQGRERVKHDTVKRKVALHLGYVGTGFKGLQRQSGTGPGEAVENELEQAVHKMGGMLDTNFGKPGRLKWSRSSRTDKGVHSLATVVAFLLECEEDVFVQDPEGVSIAEKINEHLPAQLRVLSVQRVNSGFNARAICNQRSYQYYLPASILGTTDGDKVDSSQVMALESCWKLFEGRHAFHNFTKRRLYRKQVGVQRARRKQRVEVDSEEEEEALEEDYVMDDALPISLSADTTAAGAGPAMGPRALPLTQYTDDIIMPARWNLTIDPDDKLTLRHYRKMVQCTVEGPLQLVPGGPLCFKLEVTGESFMLYQIRHMVAAAVCVARGVMTPDLVAAALAAPSRVVIPLAPPSTLVLCRSVFDTFPSAGAPSPVLQLTGSRLELRQGGQRNKERFAQQVLWPAISSLLEGDDWQAWEYILSRTKYDHSQVSHLISSHQQWTADREAMKRERQKLAEQQEKEKSAEQEEENALQQV